MNGKIKINLRRITFKDLDWDELAQKLFYM
jgi:hypothetical protein